MSGSGEGYYPSPPASNHSSPQISSDSARQLDQTFQRIRQLRRDIMQTYMPRVQDSSMGPPHEAIVLSSGEGSERQNSESSLWERLGAPVPQETMDRLRQFEAQLSGAEPTRTLRSLRMSTSHLNPGENPSPSPARESSRPSQPPSLRPHNLNLPPSPISPISPPRQPLLPPRTLEPSHPPRWTTFSDDPHTSLGRRVAAVLATSNDRPTTQEQSSSEERRSSQIPLVRDLEHVLSISRPQVYVESYRHEVDRLSRNQDLAASSSRNGLRRARQIRAESRQTSASGSGSRDSRLSTLSNFSVQNLPTPTSTLSHPALLFEEPTSYEPYASTQPEERMESIYEESRSNIPNPRQETIESGPWDGAGRGSSVFTSPPRESEYYRRRVIRYPEDVVPPSDVIRLNADGDPIPFTGGDAVAQEHSPVQGHWPRWINGTSLDDYVSELQFSLPPRPNHQIVILPDGQEEIWPSSSLEIAPTVIGKSDPFSPDPLPMPLPCETSRAHCHDIRVSRADSLIAR